MGALAGDDEAEQTIGDEAPGDEGRIRGDQQALYEWCEYLIDLLLVIDDDLESLVQAEVEQLGDLKLLVRGGW